jgi:hypothetical protein
VNLQFNADAISISSQDGIVIVGLADSTTEPRQYLILQRSLEASQQDQELGQDTFYYEVSSQQMSGYGGIKTVTLMSTNLIIEFDSPDNRQIQRVDVHFNISIDEWRNLLVGLRAVFDGSTTDFVTL